ncbi:MAG: hypothetical protein M5U19_06690 [Microthrixaceae bacterium]|nr:hypothetical protein [Microthrixaceae bacterium]
MPTRSGGAYCRHHLRDDLRNRIGGRRVRRADPDTLGHELTQVGVDDGGLHTRPADVDTDRVRASIA